MAGSIGPLASGAITLAGSLIGVFVGFRLDRRAEQRREREAVLEYLKSIREELKNNKQVVTGNYRVIADIQGSDSTSDHYALSLCSSSAWNAAVGNQIVEEIDGDLYADLQQLYSKSQSMNEQIKRLRTEPLYDEIESEEEDEFGVKIWTIPVRYWDDTHDSVESAGLGDLIQKHCNDVKMDIEEVETSIESEIEDLRMNSSKKRTIPTWEIPS